MGFLSGGPRQSIHSPLSTHFVLPNPTYFATWFRHVTGVSPHGYLARYRVQRAQALLLATHLTLDQVAEATGHANRSHLTRAFRRLMGTTPTRLRRER